VDQPELSHNQMAQQQQVHQMLMMQQENMMR
jgi:hypothetical protein